MRIFFDGLAIAAPKKDSATARSPFVITGFSDLLLYRPLHSVNKTLLIAF